MIGSVLFLLNSMYQQVIGPLQAAARGGPEGLGNAVAICHGKRCLIGQGPHERSGSCATSWR